MLANGGLCVRSSTDWKHEVVAVGRKNELPVLGVVTRVSGTLEGEGHDPGLVGQGRRRHALDGVCRRRTVS